MKYVMEFDANHELSDREEDRLMNDVLGILTNREIAANISLLGPYED